MQTFADLERTKVVPPEKKYAPAHSYASSTPSVKLVEGFGKGLMSDIKRKAPFLASDITDGFSIKVRKQENSNRGGKKKPLALLCPKRDLTSGGMDSTRCLVWVF